MLHQENFKTLILDFDRKKRENASVDFERGKRDRYFVMSKGDNVLAILEFLSIQVQSATVFTSMKIKRKEKTKSFQFHTKKMVS